MLFHFLSEASCGERPKAAESKGEKKNPPPWAAASGNRVESVLGRRWHGRPQTAARAGGKVQFAVTLQIDARGLGGSAPANVKEDPGPPLRSSPAAPLWARPGGGLYRFRKKLEGFMIPESHKAKNKKTYLSRVRSGCLYG